MQIISYAELRGIQSKLDTRTILRGARQAEPTKNLFLSYSSKDVDILAGVVKILENHGASVYVDRADNHIPETPSAETARILRDNIRYCRKLVVFVTPNSKGSYWVPWELGLGDGLKAHANVALFPASETGGSGSWSKVEYLGLYRRIILGTFKGEHKSQWMVHDHFTNIGTRLREWINAW